MRVSKAFINFIFNHFFNLWLCLTSRSNPCIIDQLHSSSSMNPFNKYWISSCTWKIIDYNSILFQNTVYKSTFTDIWSAHNAYLNWFLFHWVIAWYLLWACISIHSQSIQRIYLGVCVKIWIFLRSGIQQVKFVLQLSPHCFSVILIFTIRRFYPLLIF